MSREEYVCDAVFHPAANALADCQRCGWPISRHRTSEQTLYQKGPFGPEDESSAASLRAALQKREQEVAELNRKHCELTKMYEALTDLAEKRSKRWDELASQLHAANNELTVMRLERDIVKRFACRIRRFGETSDEGMFIGSSGGEGPMQSGELNVQFCTRGRFGDADELLGLLRKLRSEAVDRTGDSGEKP
jgi:hypothetical protein